MKYNQINARRQSLLQQFSLLSISFLANSAASGQIVYTNLEPDIVLDPEKLDNINISDDYEIDAQGDGIHDFEIINKSQFYTTYSGWWSTSGTKKGALLLPKNQQAFLGTSAYDYVYALNYGVEIGVDDPWVENPVGPADAAGLLAYHPYNETLLRGVWENKEGRFAGLRIKAGGTVNYGWVRLSVSDNSDVVYIHDYAYENSAGSSILAGETGLECNPPFLLTPVVLSPTQVKLKWQAVADAAQYKLRYRQVGVASWTTMNIPYTKTSKIVSGLTCETGYEWEMRTICDGGLTVSEFSDTKTFSTADCRIGNNTHIVEMDVFPNPASEFIQLSIEGWSEKVTVEITGLNGKGYQSHIVSPEDQIELDIGTLPQGIYLIRCFDGGNEEVRKIVVL